MRTYCFFHQCFSDFWLTGQQLVVTENNRLVSSLRANKLQVFTVVKLHSSWFLLREKVHHNDYRGIFFCVWLMNDDLVNGNVTKLQSRICHTTSQRPGSPSPGLPTFQSQRDLFNWLQEEHWKYKSEKKSICISSLGKKIFPFLWKYFFAIILNIKVIYHLDLDQYLNQKRHLKRFP